MFFKSKKVLGLDIGTSSIKVAELEIGKKGAQLVNFGFAPTPPGIINGGDITESGALSEAIANLIKEVKSKRKTVSVGIWGSAVVIKKITVPRMEESVLREQIKWEAEQYIPFDINSINLDYYMLQGRPDNQDSMEVLLIAAQKDFIFKYAETVENASLSCEVVDVSGFALSNCFQFNYGKLSGEVVALMDIGAGVTNFVVIENGDVIFSRDVLVGGLNYTTDIHKQMNVSIEEAENLKISASTGQPVPQEVYDTIAATNESVIDELQRGFEFFRATVSENPIQRIFVTGGSIGVPGLVDQISKGTSIPYEVLNPFTSISLSPKKFEATYGAQISAFSVVALGLALRQIGDKK